MTWVHWKPGLVVCWSHAKLAVGGGMRCCGALCDHPYSFCFLCSCKSTAGGEEGLEHVGRGGIHWVTELGLCSPSHSSSQHGLPFPSHLPPFWGQRVIYIKSFGLSMDLTTWEASLYHCTISFLSVWPPIWPNGVWGQEFSSSNWAFLILLWHPRVVSVFNHKYLLKV